MRADIREDGAFSRRIDYVHDELPQLSPEDTIWVAVQLAQQGFVRPGVP